MAEYFVLGVRLSDADKDNLLMAILADIAALQAEFESLLDKNC